MQFAIWLKKDFLMVDKSYQTMGNIMKRKKGLMEQPCSECGGTLERKAIIQEFEREGIKIKLSGENAWVCNGCGETYFKPGGENKVVKAANCLFELARTEKQHKGTLIAQI